eukprot:TRINITY_DN6743_c0_g2_i1.p1 TRINITY_DN6743_c0_g2~~TRINITY_DN6743_c0_g2_i1.p1  ORF type:complete len:546 (+),score=141.86 TRINITY_DN6743_c0_g2_i1:235-1638(+)
MAGPDAAWAASLELLCPPSEAEDELLTPDAAIQLGKKVAADRPPPPRERTEANVTPLVTAGEAMRPKRQRTSSFSSTRGYSAAKQPASLGFFGGALENVFGARCAGGGWRYSPMLPEPQRTDHNAFQTRPDGSLLFHAVVGGTDMEAALKRALQPDDPDVLSVWSSTPSTRGYDKASVDASHDPLNPDTSHGYLARQCAGLIRRLDDGSVQLDKARREVLRCVHLITKLKGTDAPFRSAPLRFDSQLQRFESGAGAEEFKRALQICISCCSKGPPQPLASRVHPIILVPSSVAAVVSIWNAQAFFGQGKWVQSTQAREDARSGAGAKTSLLAVDRAELEVSREGCPFKTFVLKADPGTLKPEHWRNVCAVVTTGQLWELKGFYPQRVGDQMRDLEPREVFDRVQGYHFAMDDSDLPESVRKWRVEVFRVSKAQTRRHMDLVVVERFWTSLLQRMRYMKQFRPFFTAD